MTADQTALIYYRVDGEIVLTPLSRSRAECESLIGSCFEWSGAGNAAKKNYSQDVDNDTSLDGIPVKLDGIKKEVEVRVHFRSLTKTDKVCAFRILNVGSEILTLETLGLSDVECSVLKNGVKMANGLFLICGPTGSGKSTMMVSVMNEKSKYKVMHTLEDPIETKCPDKLTFQGKGTAFIFFSLSASQTNTSSYQVIGDRLVNMRRDFTRKQKSTWGIKDSSGNKALTISPLNNNAANTRLSAKN